jgi:hypothetical protein
VLRNGDVAVDVAGVHGGAVAQVEDMLRDLAGPEADPVHQVHLFAEEQDRTMGPKPRKSSVLDWVRFRTSRTVSMAVCSMAATTTASAK